ncbi:hypothetical protein [Halalkalibacter urbisdiaboli]|uniref:hypothetical protein n=1 Tax=Halalkalibacter urbisdiaboli TaxID=1960589 RepID=UPI000B44A8F1|nr:hypothetical protein [Halalkalibacter urbisdiaboli]
MKEIMFDDFHLMQEEQMERMKRFVVCMGVIMLVACEQQELHEERFVFTEEGPWSLESSEKQTNPILGTMNQDYGKQGMQALIRKWSIEEQCQPSLYCEELQETMSTEELVRRIESGQVRFSYQHSDDLARNSEIRRELLKEFEKLYYSKTEELLW